MSDKISDKIKEIASASQRNPLDVYYDLYTLVLKPAAEDDCPALLRQLTEATQSISYDSDAGMKTVTDAEVEMTVQKYQGTLREMVQSLMTDDLAVDEFYTQLWICLKTPFFRQSDLTMTVLLYLLGEKIPGIPYYKAENLLHLSNEEYHRAIGLIEEKLNEGKSMAQRTFEQRTETVSQLYRISGTIDDTLEADGRKWTKDELRIVFWSVISRIFEAKGMAMREKEDE